MLHRLARSISLETVLAAATVAVVLIAISSARTLAEWRTPWVFIASGCCLVLVLFPKRMRGWPALPLALAGMVSLILGIIWDPQLKSVYTLMLCVVLMGFAPLASWTAVLVSTLFVAWGFSAAITYSTVHLTEEIMIRLFTNLISMFLAAIFVKAMATAQSRIKDLNARLSDLLAKESDTASRVRDELQRTLDLSMDLIATLNFRGEVRSINSAGQHLLGFAVDSVVGADLNDHVHPDDAMSLRTHLAMAAGGNEVRGFQARFRRGDGGWAWMESHARPIPGEQMLFCISRDITERKAAEEALRRAKLVVENSPVVHFRWRLDDGWPVEYASENVGKLGLAMGAVGGQSVRFLESVHADDRDRLDLARRELVQTGMSHTLEYRIHVPGRGIRWVQERVVTERRADGQPVFLQGVLVDVTDTRLAEEQLEHLAYHDTLTGLPNRALFLSNLTAAVDAPAGGKGGLAVLFVGLDGFKVVNDSLGHHVGDQLLVEVGRRLSECVGNRGMVARVGGDEFTILLGEVCNEEEALRCAEKVRGTIAKAVAARGRELFVTASIGIALGESGDPHELMRFADIAMYQAKRLGKDRYEVYNPAMNAWAEARLNLELDLRKALERGEFRLVYQPIWSLNAKRVTGLEALIRWHHPKRGSVSPADFIPLAEENGLIIPIGRWVLDEVCRQLAQWQERYPGAQLPAMSVNLSLRQFQDPALAGEFEEIVRRHGLKPGAIQLEITESTLMLDQAATLRTLKRLSDVGFYLALDDFGTGYSAWAHLKGFPFNCIKIDRSFMHGLGQDEESAAIVAAMIDLARALGLEVVAEGIETELQLDVLRALGCGKGQGYLLSRPLPVTETEALVAAGAGPLVDEERS